MTFPAGRSYQAASYGCPSGNGSRMTALDESSIRGHSHERLTRRWRHPIGNRAGAGIAHRGPGRSPARVGRNQCHEEPLPGRDAPLLNFSTQQRQGRADTGAPAGEQASAFEQHSTAFS